MDLNNTSQTDNFCERVVAFVDILGVRENFKNSDESSYIQGKNVLLNAIKKISTMNQTERKVITKIGSEVKSDDGMTLNMSIENNLPEVSSYSDHIVISSSLTQLSVHEKDMRIYSVIKSVLDLSVDLLRQGFALRGGITIGDLYHHKNTVLGRALIEAVELEEKVAVYPRVVLSKRIIDFIRIGENGNFPIFFPKYLKADFDGLYFINYFLAINCNQLPFKFLMTIKDIIKTELEKNKDKIGLLKKWVWVANHFNESLQSWKGCNPVVFPDYHFEEISLSL